MFDLDNFPNYPVLVTTQRQIVNPDGHFDD